MREIKLKVSLLVSEEFFTPLVADSISVDMLVSYVSSKIQESIELNANIASVEIQSVDYPLAYRRITKKSN